MGRIRYEYVTVLLAAVVALGGMWFPDEPPPKSEATSKPAVARSGSASALGLLSCRQAARRRAHDRRHREEGRFGRKRESKKRWPG